VTSDMVFQPPLVLDSNSGDAARNFPISLRIFDWASDRGDLYRLRYTAFREAGWIAESDERIFVDQYDALPSTFAVGAYHEGACIGSLRLALGGAGHPPGTMPCQEQFPDEVRELGAKRLVEFSRMATDPSLTNRSFRTTLYASLVRAGLIVTAAAEIDVTLIAVHRRVSPFYQAMCGFQVVAKSDTYAGISEPTNFLSLRFQDMEKRRRRSNAFFAFSEQEIESARQAVQAAHHRPQAA
jgi:N-acyl-L-homoserine lactone synthetase